MSEYVVKDKADGTYALGTCWGTDRKKAKRFPHTEAHKFAADCLESCVVVRIRKVPRKVPVIQYDRFSIWVDDRCVMALSDESYIRNVAHNLAAALGVTATERK